MCILSENELILSRNYNKQTKFSKDENVFENLDIPRVQMNQKTQIEENKISAIEKSIIG